MNYKTEIIIYTRPWCGYCSAAKELLTKKGFLYKEINVEENEGQLNIMIERSGRKTVPQIFIGKKPIGGYSEIKNLEVSGKLDGLLNPISKPV